MDAILEHKLGFDKIRDIIAARCLTEYAADRVRGEEFSSSESQVRKRLELTDEMRLILMFEENFPTNGYIDCVAFLKPLEKPSVAIDLLSLRRLKTVLETLRKVIYFFDSVKDGVYPNLKKMSSGMVSFSEITRRIDGILDRYSEVKDTASDELYNIRKSLRDRKSTRLNSSHRL